MKPQNDSDVTWSTIGKLFVGLIGVVVLMVVFGLGIGQMGKQSSSSSSESSNAFVNTNSHYIDLSDIPETSGISDYDPADFYVSSDKTSECNIKGNIQYKTGAKIYHTPNCPYYRDTVINEDYGERWFCTEAEARKAGWRKANNCP